MAYDLYGNYYARERDAIAAETAQMAEIDAARAVRKADEAMQRLRDMQYQEHYEQQWKDEVWDRVEMLMKRVDELEARLGISHGG